MRYPVTATGTKQDFEKYWYIPKGGEFGYPRKNLKGVVTYYHEGLDINLKTGGDTDLNEELKAISNGVIEYYHVGHSATNNTFGRHHAYKIEGPWGVRWVHKAHCSELDFKGSVQNVSEGQIISRIGKSGTTVAHLHMSIFKVDPKSIGLDKIAINTEELHKYWEDPIAFIDKWMSVPPDPTPPVNDQSKYDFGQDFGIMELQRAKSIMQDQKNKLNEFGSKIAQVKSILE